MATLVLETAGDTRSHGTPRRSAAADASGDILLEVESASKPRKAATSDLLPKSLDGWIVQGIQPVPGSDGDIIEGNYSPRDEKRSLVMPLVVYVQVTGASASPTQSAGERQLLNRYTHSHKEYTIEGLTVRSGRTPDGGSYFVTWVRAGAEYGVDATFRYRIPKSGGRPVVKSAADEIARAVILHKPGQGGVE